MENEDNKKPYKIKDVTRNIKKAVVAGTLEEVQKKSADKFGKTEIPQIFLDCDGTEIDDEDYFQTLEANTELIVVFEGEQWIDPTTYVTITTHNPNDLADGVVDIERIHLKKLVGQLKTNLCNVSILEDSDLEMLTNMDPNSVTDFDLTGGFIEQLKEASGRVLHQKRHAHDTIELLKMIGKQQQGFSKQNSSEEHQTLSSSNTSLSTMSSFSSSGGHVAGHAGACSSVVINKTTAVGSGTAKSS